MASFQNPLLIPLLIISCIISFFLGMISSRPASKPVCKNTVSAVQITELRYRKAVVLADDGNRYLLDQATLRIGDKFCGSDYRLEK